ncbi:unnamed protein product [Amoebophrya sp. A120]|nr:unnamed protein product [Amoebophrya sp. A120]|eukprot:GSA120T00025365001.1
MEDEFLPHSSCSSARHYNLFAPRVRDSRAFRKMRKMQNRVSQHPRPFRTSYGRDFTTDEDNVMISRSFFDSVLGPLLRALASTESQRVETFEKLGIAAQEHMIRKRGVIKKQQQNNQDNKADDEDSKVAAQQLLIEEHFADLFGFGHSLDEIAKCGSDVMLCKGLHVFMLPDVKEVREKIQQQAASLGSPFVDGEHNTDHEHAAAVLARLGEVRDLYDLIEDFGNLAVDLKIYQECLEDQLEEMEGFDDPEGLEPPWSGQGRPRRQESLADIRHWTRLGLRSLPEKAPTASLLPAEASQREVSRNRKLLSPLGVESIPLIAFNVVDLADNTIAEGRADIAAKHLAHKKQQDIKMFFDLLRKCNERRNDTDAFHISGFGPECPLVGMLPTSLHTPDGIEPASAYNFIQLPMRWTLELTLYNKLKTSMARFKEAAHVHLVQALSVSPGVSIEHDPKFASFFFGPAHGPAGTVDASETTGAPLGRGASSASIPANPLPAPSHHAVTSPAQHLHPRTPLPEKLAYMKLEIWEDRFLQLHSYTIGKKHRVQKISGSVDGRYGGPRNLESKSETDCVFGFSVVPHTGKLQTRYNGLCGLRASSAGNEELISLPTAAGVYTALADAVGGARAELLAVRKRTRFPPGSGQKPEGMAKLNTVHGGCYFYFKTAVEEKDFIADFKAFANIITQYTANTAAARKLRKVMRINSELAKGICPWMSFVYPSEVSKISFKKVRFSIPEISSDAYPDLHDPDLGDATWADLARAIFSHRLKNIDEKNKQDESSRDADGTSGDLEMSSAPGETISVRDPVKIYAAFPEDEDEIPSDSSADDDNEAGCAHDGLDERSDQEENP